jgi:hypothetical protein
MGRDSTQEDWNTSPSAMTDAEAWEIASALLPRIKDHVAAAIKRGVIDLRDQEDEVNDAMVGVVELAKRHDPHQGEFEHYVSATLGRRYRGRRPRTDAMERLVMPADSEGEPVPLTELAPAATQEAPAVLDSPTGADAILNISGDIEDYLRSIYGKSHAQTARLRHIVVDYCLMGVPMDALVKRYRVSPTTVVQVLKHAPCRRGNLTACFCAEFRQKNLQQRIAERVPPRLQAIAHMALVNGVSVAEIARRTGRRRPGEKNHLRDRLKEIFKCVGRP